MAPGCFPCSSATWPACQKLLQCWGPFIRGTCLLYLHTTQLQCQHPRGTGKTGRFLKSIVLSKASLTPLPKVRSIVLPACCLELNAEILPAQERAGDTAHSVGWPSGGAAGLSYAPGSQRSGFAASKPSRAGEKDSARGPQRVSRTRGHLTCGHLTCGHLTAHPALGATQQTLRVPAPERGSSERLTRRRSRVSFFGDGMK